MLLRSPRPSSGHACALFTLFLAFSDNSGVLQASYGEQLQWAGLSVRRLASHVGGAGPERTEYGPTTDI